MERINLVALLLFVSCLIIIDYAPDSFAQPVDCLASDREALIDFKNGLQDTYGRLSSWRGSNCCQWHGIRCDNITGAVVAMDLGGADYVSGGFEFYDMSGEIRPSLMKLKSSLRYLNLSFNSFNGIPIPAFIGSLENLQYLDLSNAGFGGKIPPNLRNLTHLKFLDLSSSSLDVENLQWVTGLVSLEHLAMNGLNLSSVGTDWVSKINQLPSLIELHLSACSLFGHIPSLPSLNFTSLAVVNLDSNNFMSKIPHWLVNVTSLQHLDLSDSGMYGRIPLGFGELPNLLALTLGGNNLTANCSQLFMSRWENIQMLDLPSNKLHGKLPSSLGNLTTLVYLDLSGNAIEGDIPRSVGKLCNLKTLTLRLNKITGNLPEHLEGTNNCPSRKPLPNLERLDLSNNQLVGKIPDWLHQAENLVDLYLQYNLLEGPIPISFGSLQNLSILRLTGNKLNGTLPKSTGQLSGLSVLDVSYNQLAGTVSEVHFSKLSKLKTLQLTSNSFTVSVSSNWVPPFQLEELGMGSCVLGPSFPAWLKSQNALWSLDLSNTSISGPIPNWLWNISAGMMDFNISHNELQGRFPNLFPMSLYAHDSYVDLSFNLFEGPLIFDHSKSEFPTATTGTAILDLSHNRFSGPVPRNTGHIMSDLMYLSLSHNQLQGEIPLSLGQMSSLLVLDLSNNNLTGRIPPSLSNCSDLKVLDLKSNTLFGTIPNSLGQLLQLISLHLSSNHFWGSLPSSFRNLSNLETIDLGNNGFSGIIPPWLGDGFARLRILSLRSNAFSGRLPSKLSKLSSLQVLDLARNNLVGSIPLSLGYLEAIVGEQKNNTYLLYGDYGGRYYEESMVVTTKGQPQTYTKTLSLVTSIDLSDNNFSGNIPHEITKLSGLVVLNLSRNHIAGQIPESMSNLHQLSSLDLSCNQLSGTIPTSLSSLSFLGYLNLSNNNLFGAIPYTGHMTTFDEPCFAGNPGLCGPPLHVKCPGDDDPTHDYDKGRGNKNANEGGLIDKWLYLSLGLGFASGILVPYFIFAIKRSWGGTYFALVDLVVYKLLRLRHRN